jgi:hypothetical protein
MTNKDKNQEPKNYDEAVRLISQIAAKHKVAILILDKEYVQNVIEGNQLDKKFDADEIYDILNDAAYNLQDSIEEAVYDEIEGRG